MVHHLRALLRGEGILAGPHRREALVDAVELGLAEVHAVLPAGVGAIGSADELAAGRVLDGNDLAAQLGHDLHGQAPVAEGEQGRRGAVGELQFGRSGGHRDPWVGGGGLGIGPGGEDRHLSAGGGGGFAGRRVGGGRGGRHCRPGQRRQPGQRPRRRANRRSCHSGISLAGRCLGSVAIIADAGCEENAPAVAAHRGAMRCAARAARL